MTAGVNSYYKFNEVDLSVAAGGESVIDQPKLHIYSLSEADDFIKSYGFDYSNEEDRTKLWYFYRRSLVLLIEKLKFDEKEIPDKLKSPEGIEDLRHLLIWASGTDEHLGLQKWSCAMLRCMHAFIHSEVDLFSSFSEAIQKQILTPFENCVVYEDKMYLRSFKKEGHRQIELHHFSTKPFKTSSSSVIKLLAKKEAIVHQILDKVGVRFVTPTIFDAFQVLRFLIDESIISYAHILPDQSSNNLYPVQAFVEVCNKLEAKHGSEYILESRKIDRLLQSHIKNKNSSIFNLFRKENPFSSKDFRYIKFIVRRLIQIEPPAPGVKGFSFYYPYEVQILNKSTFDKMNEGDSDHNAYKIRQTEAARKRVYQ